MLKSSFIFLLLKTYILLFTITILISKHINAQENENHKSSVTEYESFTLKSWDSNHNTPCTGEADTIEKGLFDSCHFQGNLETGFVYNFSYNPNDNTGNVTYNSWDPGDDPCVPPNNTTEIYKSSYVVYNKDDASTHCKYYPEEESYIVFYVHEVGHFDVLTPTQQKETYIVPQHTQYLEVILKHPLDGLKY